MESGRHRPAIWCRRSVPRPGKPPKGASLTSWTLSLAPLSLSKLVTSSKSGRPHPGLSHASTLTSHEAPRMWDHLGGRVLRASSALRGTTSCRARDGLSCSSASKQPRTSPAWSIRTRSFTTRPANMSGVTLKPTLLRNSRRSSSVGSWALSTRLTPSTLLLYVAEFQFRDNNRGNDNIYGTAIS